MYFNVQSNSGIAEACTPHWTPVKKSGPQIGCGAILAFRFKHK
jgi:hypothetical protein